MGRIFLLDSTLRDGGYINNWGFGLDGIRSIIKKLEQTKIEMIEVGFLKGDDYNPDQTLYPNLECIENVLQNKKKDVLYLAMLDMSKPIPMERINKNNTRTVDGIRVIFKKDKTNEAYSMCKYIKQMGYKVFVNFVNTDAYSDKEFIEGIEKFSQLCPDGVTIVDTFGLMKRKQIKRLVSIADNNLDENVMLCYHAHNNLQQAFGNAEAIVEMNLKRDVVIDACVFGMGRGAGNLNLELFAEYMNDNYECNYQISPMLEIMDEYLNDFYKTKFWGYSLPLYLSASRGCHPDYAIYLAEKNSLTEKSFDELLKSISPEDKMIFSKDKAETYYKKYMEKYYDDSEELKQLSEELKDQKILLVCPGKTIKNYRDKIDSMIKKGYSVIEVNFYDDSFLVNYVFIGNNRRFEKIIANDDIRIIATSNILDSDKADYKFNFSSLTGEDGDIFGNSGLMAIRLLEKIGIKDIVIAGMDGYFEKGENYYENGFETYRINNEHEKNAKMAKELEGISKRVSLHFLTPTNYYFVNQKMI